MTSCTLQVPSGQVTLSTRYKKREHRFHLITFEGDRRPEWVWWVVWVVDMQKKCKKDILVPIQNIVMRKRKLQLPTSQLMKWHINSSKEKKKDSPLLGTVQFKSWKMIGGSGQSTAFLSLNRPVPIPTLSSSCIILGQVTVPFLPQFLHYVKAGGGSNDHHVFRLWKIWFLGMEYFSMHTCFGGY